MPTIDRLLDSLRRAHDGTPWHGPSRADVLADVTAEEAAWRPAPDAHTIWELVLHMRSWTREVLRRAKGEVPADPADGDFPPMPEPADAAAWEATLRSLDESHAALVAYVVAMNNERRAARVAARPGEDARRTLTQRVMIRSLAEHDVYHTGQLALMKRLARGTLRSAVRDVAVPPLES
jgi:uncharacterized damage-inducible protein DinB